MRAASYCRISTAEQNPRSLIEQAEACRNFIERQGWVFVGAYEDEAVSGSTLARPALDRLRADASARRLDVLVVDNIERLSRGFDGMQLVFTELDSLGVRVFDVRTGTDSTSASARMIYGTSILVSSLLIEQTRAATQRALTARARDGFVPGNLGYGYRAVPEANPRDSKRPRKRAEVNPTEAEVIREIFSARARGTSCVQIARDLNRRKVPAPVHRGRRQQAGWSANGIRSMLSAERFNG